MLEVPSNWIQMPNNLYIFTEKGNGGSRIWDQMVAAGSYHCPLLLWTKDQPSPFTRRKKNAIQIYISCNNRKLFPWMSLSRKLIFWNICLPKIKEKLNGNLLIHPQIRFGLRLALTTAFQAPLVFTLSLPNGVIVYKILHKSGIPWEPIFSNTQHHTNIHFVGTSLNNHAHSAVISCPRARPLYRASLVVCSAFVLTKGKLIWSLIRRSKIAHQRGNALWM